MIFSYNFGFLILLLDSFINIACFYDIWVTGSASFAELFSIIVKVIAINTIIIESISIIVIIIFIYIFFSFF